MTWIIVGIILLLIAGLLACPVIFTARYCEKLTAEVRYLFITYSLTKSDDKGMKKKKKHKKPQVSEIKEKKKKKSAFSQMIAEDGISGFLSFLSELAELAFASLLDLLKHCYLSKFLIFILVAAEEPDETAVDYGACCAVVYPVSSLFLSNCRHEKKARVEVRPDFMSAESSAVAEIKARVSLFFVVKAAVISLIKFFISRVKNTMDQNKK